MAIRRLSTGVTHRSAGSAYRSGSFLEPRDFAMTAVLVEHPRGDLLIDTGLGTAIDTQIQAMPSWFRATTRYTRGRSAAEQLDAAGYAANDCARSFSRTRTGITRAEFPSSPGHRSG